MVMAPPDWEHSALSPRIAKDPLKGSEGSVDQCVGHNRERC